ncbi:MAG: S9 family peptidase, partial [Acidobacteria bacterium]|nr:S9 family peptidase [Acidobacteriota bacterium]
MSSILRPFRHATAAVLVLAGILALGPAAPPAAARGMTPADVARIEYVDSVAVSPDGTHIAYAKLVPRRPMVDEDGPAWHELHVLAKDGTSMPFVTGQVTVQDISWTPDGRQVVFRSKRGSDEETGLWAIPVDGGEARRLLSHDTSIAAYSLSPDGGRVAFLAEEPVPEGVEEQEKQGFTQEVFEEDWRDTKVWVAGLGDGAGEARRLDLLGTASAVRWAPAGNRLAVVLQPTPAVDDEYMKSKLHVVDADTGKDLVQIANPGKLGEVRWSPDGKRLAMLSAADLNDPSAGRLAVADAATGALTFLLPELEGDVVSFEWADAGSVLAVVAQGARHGIWRVGVDGAADILIEPGVACWEDLSLSADASTVVARGDAASHPPELFRVAGDSVERMTSSNPWIADLELAPQELITYQARDGLTIEGVLIRPLGAETGKRYPLIVDVHGGPEAHNCDGWRTTYSRPGQMAAAQGMAVLAPNYRGSTGRGVAFAKLHQGDPAGKEFDDLVDGVDHLIAAGLVDAARVGITGGSYGGFATAWGATYYSERYAAAVMFVGISNHISKAFNTDIANEMYLVHQRKRVWEDWQFFLERSPIYYARQAKTPLLILHGDSDPRVNPEQSLEMFRAIKLAGDTPVRFVSYPGEGHGNRRAAARFDYSLRMMRWFE